MTRRQEVNRMKLDWATYHYAHISKNVDDICKAVNMSPQRLGKMMKWSEWEEALAYWLLMPQGDLGLAENLWTEMIENGDDLSGVEYPDKLMKSRHKGDPDVYALIQSHLFCVDGLTADEIQAHLANENNDGMKPVHYDGQYLENAYHWWIFPNEPEGLYSKVFARANVVGDLVIGSGEEICLVIIRHGRLTITRQISDDVANIHDERLLVCL